MTIGIMVASFYSLVALAALREFIQKSRAERKETKRCLANRKLEEREFPHRFKGWESV